MKHKPLVSVITIFLNSERFIQEAIDSVSAQTYDTWELLLVDDGSTDGSTNISLRYAEQYPEKVRYLEHENHKNRGMSASRNLGIRHAKGEYIAFLDSDDVWLPQKLEKQVTILDSQPEAAMVYGATFYWYSWSGKPEDFTRDYVPEFGFKPNTLFKPPRLLTLAYPLGKAYAPCPSDLIFCRDVIDQIGGFEESFQGIYQLYEDQAFLAKVYLKIPVYVSSECWTKYRLHPDSCVSVVTKAGRYHKVRFYFLNWLEKYLSKQGVKDAMILKALQHSLWSYRYPILSRLYPILQRLHLLMYHLLGHNWLHIIHGLKRKTTVNTSKIQVFSMNNLTGLQPAYEGYHDGANCNMISGWVWDSNNADIPIKVNILADNVLVDTIAAEEFRKDLFNAGKGNGHHAFNYFTPSWLKDGRSHTVLIKVAGTDFNLNSTPKQIKCEFQIISDIRRLKAKLRSPVLKMRAILTKWIDKEYCPPVGQVRFGNLRRVTPISRVWGTDRGCPVDRYYIENFLACPANDIKGRVLEIGNNHYTRQFGRNRVTQSDVLNLLEEPGTTIVADITNAPHIPSNTFDCIICTQTLQLIYDVRAAIQTLYRILKPGGVLLATLSGISQTYDREWGEYWCWNFTSLTSRRLFEEVFAAADVSVEAYGNVLAATSFLHGLAAEELRKEELDYHDPGYNVSITVKAVKPSN